MNILVQSFLGICLPLLFLDKYLGVELFGSQDRLTFNFFKLFFSVFFTPTSSIREFQLLHILTRIYCFFSFYHFLWVFSSSTSCIPLIIKMWNTFISVYWPFTCFLMSFSLLKTELVVLQDIHSYILDKILYQITGVIKISCPFIFLMMSSDVKKF